MNYEQSKWLEFVLDYFFSLGRNIRFSIFNHKKYCLYILEGHPKLSGVIKITENKTIMVDLTNFDSKSVFITDLHTEESVIKRLTRAVNSLTKEL